MTEKDRAISDNAKGALFMALSMVGYILNDTFFKLVMTDLFLFQAILIRGIVASALILALAWHFNALRYRPNIKDRKLIGLRVIGEVGGTMCYLTALSYLPIANATAILQVIPLTVTLAAAWFFGETVGWRRYSAILIGFAGVLIIVRPGAAGFDWHAVWALAAVLFLTLRDSVTRRLSPDVPSLFVTVLTAVTITAIALLLVPFNGWAPPTSSHIWMMVYAALFLLVGYSFWCDDDAGWRGSEWWHPIAIRF